MIYIDQRRVIKTMWRCIAYVAVMFLPHLLTAKADVLPDKVNLALRRTAHILLKIAGDTTSQIPSIEHPKDGVWRVRLEQTFNYDSLPAVLQASFLLHNIDLPYDVTIRKCEDGTIDLGYNYLDFTKGDGVACGGRERSEGCQYMEVSFLTVQPTHQFKMVNGLWILLVVLGFIGIWLFRRGRLSNNSQMAIKELPSTHDLKWLEFGNSRLDVANQVLICQDAKYSLTFREAKLLSLFATNINKVLERDYIIQQVWADEGVLVGRSVDVFVSRLRKKIAEDTSLGLSVVHGVGYRLESSKVA